MKTNFARITKGLGVVLLCLLTLPGLAQSKPVRDFGISGQIPWENTQGYTPVILNIWSAKKRTVIIRVSGAAQKNQAEITLNIPGGKNIYQTLLMPPSSRGQWRYNLEWETTDGRKGKHELSAENDHKEIDAVVVDPSSTVSWKETVSHLRSMQATVDSGHGGYGYHRETYGRNRITYINPKALPDKWQGYPYWLQVVITPQGAKDLTEAQKEALISWSHMGGQILVTHEEVAEAWKAGGAKITLIDPTTEKGAKTWGKAIQDTLIKRNYVPTAKPVPGTDEVPVEGFIVLAILFALLVGPANMFWVKRKNARPLFLLTTPLLSFATCMGLFVFNIYAEGLTLKRTLVQLTYLDLHHHKAYSWTGGTFFGAFSTSELGEDEGISGQTKIVMANPDNFMEEDYRYDRNRRSDPITVNWSKGQKATGTLIQGRVNRQVVFEDVRVERARVTLEMQNNVYHLTNLLGVDIKDFHWIDHNRQAWACKAVPSGKRIPLDKISAWKVKETDKYNPERRLFPVNNQLGANAQAVWQKTRHVPYTFTARLNGPFGPVPGPEGDTLSTEALVTGTVFPGGTP